MKTLVSVLLLTLVLVLYHISADTVAPDSLTQRCCPNCTRTPIPKGRVTKVVMTHSACRLKAIVVTTVCKNEICVDGNWTWAKKLLSDFEKSAAGKMPPSAPFNRLPCSKGANKV
ncbi:C-C motif chemokine 19-like [Chaetodon trifascialis]|uniref:C-C motif chemokine 19-like n=1 Tax=Chaetodon trifascialis TaxID=109706 RepID=UPI003992DBA4